MQKVNNKAIANIVSTVVIIFITIVAITIVYTYVNRTVLSVQYSPQMSCLDMQLSRVLEIKKACFNAETNNTELTISRKFQSSVLSLDFVASSASSTAAWCCNKDCPNCIILDEGQSKTYKLNYPEFQPNDKISILVSSCKLDSAPISPVC